MVSPLDKQSYAFALNIVLLCKSISQTNKEFVLTNQLLKSATSIGANIRESQQAQSRNDFIAKLHISLKEANETRYLVDLLKDSGYLAILQAQEIHQQLNSIISMLITSIATAKQNKLNTLNT
jgi:four helix bundle protein